MALFKIMRGASSRISTDVTAFHDGYAYFTPDDGGFYIDAEYNGEQKRYRINPIGAGSVAVNATLLASGWSAGQQTIEVQGVSPDTNGFIGLSQTVTDAEMESAKNAELYVCGQGQGTVTIATFGETPTRDIPVVVILI